MLDATTAGFLEGGCALIVGIAASDGEPHATRGWGLTILDTDPLTARLLLPAEDAWACTQLASGAPVAVTGADVPTLRSLQVKGRSLGIEAASDDDRVRAERYIASFFGDITASDRYPRSVVDRMRPRDLVACTITLDEVYDQTPGPDAGARRS